MDSACSWLLLLWGQGLQRKAGPLTEGLTAASMFPLPSQEQGKGGGHPAS